MVDYVAALEVILIFCIQVLYTVNQKTEINLHLDSLIIIMSFNRLRKYRWDRWTEIYMDRYQG